MAHVVSLKVNIESTPEARKRVSEAMRRVMTDITWVCQACGKHEKSRDDFRDVSCRTWALRCWTHSLVFRSDGSVASCREAKSILMQPKEEQSG